MKRIITLFFAAMLAGQAWAEDFIIGNLKYTVTDAEKHEVSVGKISDNNKPTGDIVIPEEVENKSVKYTVTSLDGEAFRYCSFTSLYMPKSINAIGLNSFYGCFGLTEITVDEANPTFSSNDGVLFNKNQTELILYPVSKSGSYTIPNSVTSIRSGAFYDCKNLTSINIPGSVKHIGNFAFIDCTGLTEITIPDGVTAIGGQTFEYCSNLTSVTIPESVTEIDFNAFSYCTSLTSITIPSSVKEIKASAFRGCYNLTEMDLSNNQYYSFENQTLFNKDKTVLITYLNSSATGEYTVPNMVTRIADNAFCQCNISSVIIPETVTSIGTWAFMRCWNLTSIKIPNSVTSFGSVVFSECDNLQYNELGNALYLGNEQNPYLVLIKAKSETLSICEINSHCKIIDGAAFANCSIDTIKINTNAIGTIFKGNTSLKAVFISDSVTQIDKNAFSGCNNIKTLSFNTNAVGNMFAGNTSIEKLIVGDSVTEIAEKAFYGCSNLDTIIIPKTVKSIGKDAFVCKGTCGDDARWTYDMLTKTLTISGTGRMNDYGYDFDTHTDIETPWVDFADKIESVVVEEGITSLGSSLFDFNTNIKYVSLPSTCTNYSSAFNLCRNLQKVVVKARTVMSVNSYSFDNYENCTLYVPMDMVDFYKNEIVFRDFSEIIGAYMVTIDNIANGTISVDSSAILPGGSFTITVSPNEGYRINSVLVNGNAIEKNDTAYLVENVNENLTVSATFSLLKSGKCGENLTWKYDGENQTLTISGTGDMYDYEEDKTPWSTLKDKLEISTIVIEDGVTSIGDNAFGCVKATIIEVGATVSKLGKNNFMNYYSNTNGNVTTTTLFSSYVYIYGTEIVDIDGAFSDTFRGGWGTIYVPIKNLAQITDSKVFEGYDIKVLCTITVADDIVNGSISVQKTCIAGNTIEIRIIPKTGFKTESVTADGKPIELNNKKYLLVVDSNIVLSATFKPIDYQISTYSDHGQIKVVETAHYGDTVSFTVEPDKGYKVLYTSVCDINYRDVDMINDSMFVMPAKNVQIAITFEKEEEKDHTAVTETTSNMADIYTSGNKIVVENATEDIFVYNAMGALVDRVNAADSRTEIIMNESEGVYIVKTGNTVKRVFVK
ncbi:MAG: leucine-rich repeat domain-containing protein [Bacteroidales bacterium]|nr:leucine-rich repeat domain-containing protein [Bacteroidales bacterium]